MTAAVYRSTPSLSLPQTQNTAPVLEFNCLYTHDLRRKQKRWKDGFLRYHTFNKRVMLYDVPRNYIGDAHWTADEVLQDGDEVMLEKDGVMVQVAEAVGRTETDLTELRRSKKKGSSERGSSPPGRAPHVAPQTPVPRAVKGMGSMAVSGVASKAPTQLKHRSLNALLGTPKGPIGKAALPAKSPFELRHDDVENEDWEQGRPPKRQRMDSPAAWNVTWTTAAAAPKPIARKEMPLWARTTDAAKQKKAPLQAGQQKLKTQEVIDLRDDEPEPERFLPGFSSDALVPPSSPPREKFAAGKQPVSVRSSSPAFQTQEASFKPTTAAERLAGMTKATPPPADAGGRVSHPDNRSRVDTVSHEPVDRPYDPKHDTKSSARRAESTIPEPRQPASAKERPSSTAKGSTLRVSAKAPKKKMLLCQDQLASKPKRISSTNTEAAADRLLDAAPDDDEDQPQKKTQRQLLEERLARIRKKEAKANVQPQQRVTEKIVVVSETNVASDDAMLAAEARAQSALQLAELDRIILPDDLFPSERASETHEDATDDAVPAQAHVHAPPLADKVPPPALVAMSAPTRKKKGVGKREIRACAQSCFQKPADAEPTPAPDLPAPSPDVEMEPPAFPPPRAQPQKEDRQFRRVVSDSSNATNAKPKRIPGAPMRFTPSPSKAQTAARQFNTNTTNAHPPPNNQNARPPKPRIAPKKPLQRAVSLNTTAAGISAVLLGRPFQPPKPPSMASDTAAEDVAPVADPWSREAFDLFTWRPPGWCEERWCFEETEEAVGGVTTGVQQ